MEPHDYKQSMRCFEDDEIKNLKKEELFIFYGRDANAFCRDTLLGVPTKWVYKA